MYTGFRSARQVSLVKHYTLSGIENGVLPGCIQGGDVDNDGEIEMVVGETKGIVRVYKHFNEIACVQNLGTISSISVGNVYSNDRNCIVVVSAEGICTVLEYGNSKLEIVAELKISWNTKRCVLRDVDHDGITEIVLCSLSESETSESISRICCYTLKDNSTSLTLKYEWKAAGEIISLSPCTIPASCGKEMHVLLVGFSKGGFATLCFDGVIIKNKGTEALSAQFERENFDQQLQFEYRYLLENSPTLVLGEIKRSPSSSSSSMKRYDAYQDILRHGSKDVDDFTAETMEFEAIESETSHKALVATCSLGGMLRLETLEFSKDKKNSNVLENRIVWQEPLSSQIFALNAVDITGDMGDEIVSCSWDGLTCVYDRSNNVVRYTFRERVQSFWAGELTIKPTVTKVVFAYATFDGRLVVYTDVESAIPKVAAATLLDVLRKRNRLTDVLNLFNKHADPSLRKRLADNLQDIDERERHTTSLASLLRSVLYGKN